MADAACNHASAPGVQHPMVRLPGVLAACLPLTAALPCGFSQTDATGAAEVSAPEVHFSVRTEGNQTKFHMGEVIRLELLFASSVPKVYSITTTTYDRSGRLGMEEYLLSPDSGWDDPLAQRFRSRGFVGGGMTGFYPLTAEPAIIHRELNEWVRFQQPGEYRLKVKSPRVLKALGQSADRVGSVTSNELHLTILPATPEWQRETLQKALAVLAATPETKSFQQPEPARREALQTLRYLGSPAAARELARHLKDRECATDCSFGLIGSPARETGLEEMKRLLADPDYPVDNEFLSTMAEVALPADAGGDVSAERVRQEDGFRQDLASALASKRGQALATSAYAIAEHGAMYMQELPPAIRGTITDVLVANFDRLPPDKQAELMQYRRRCSTRSECCRYLRRSPSDTRITPSRGKWTPGIQTTPAARRSKIGTKSTRRVRARRCCARSRGPNRASA
jgi:hypothetical protein